jgi:chemotaxis protein methyltransferase CheR
LPHRYRIKIKFEVEEIGLKDIKRVIDTIYLSRGVDFSNYAFSSLKRRIKRFLEINKIHDINEFILKLKEEGEFADIFIKEVTVNVTEMFRDPSFWIVLRDTIIPQIGFNNTLKIWHAACSTGEEVYSMAILLKEAGLLKYSTITATDINKHVLKVASRGVYTIRSQEVNSKNYEQFGGKVKLSDYYSISDSMVHFDKQLITNVDFKCHDLALDGPIGKFDLILCRNVLIYFNFDLQEKVLQTFTQSLPKNSYLGIGSKESINWCRSARLFEEVSLEEKIYRKVTDNE